MENETLVYHDYARIIRQVAPTFPVTLLHIGVQRTLVVCGDQAQPAAVLPLAIGVDKTGEGYFKHLPPTPDEMESAIMTVEDEVIRIRRDLPVGSVLFSTDPGLVEIARLSGAKEEAEGWRLSLDGMEQTFKRLERVMLGSPASWEGIPLESSFCARLLILREFMHHHGFDELRIPAATRDEK